MSNQTSDQKKIKVPFSINSIILVYTVNTSNGMRSSLHLFLSRVLPIGLCPEIRNKYRIMSLIMLFCMNKCMFLITFCNYLMVFHVLLLVLHFIVNAELSASKLIEIGWRPGNRLLCLLLEEPITPSAFVHATG